MVFRVSNSKIKEFRKEKGLSHDELAKKLGIATSSLRSMESGSKTPSAALLKKMAFILEHSMDDFMYEDKLA